MAPTTRELESAILTRSADLAWVVIDHEVVVYRATDASSYVLNPGAGLVWQCLDSESTVGEILTDVADAFTVDRDLAVDQFLPVIGEWLELNIVTTSAQ